MIQPSTAHDESSRVKCGVSSRYFFFYPTVETSEIRHLWGLQTLDAEIKTLEIDLPMFVLCRKPVEDYSYGARRWEG